MSIHVIQGGNQAIF